MKNLEKPAFSIGFAYKVKAKAKYVHIVELDIWVETRKQNLPRLENHPILRNSIVAML